jgi:tetratricopeptide (TPR) repeat protein
MRTKLVFPFSALVLLAATSAYASMGGGNTPAPTPPASTTPDVSASSSDVRRQADSWYHDAYNAIAKAKRELEEGKSKNADKQFRKALERAQRAVEIDSTYHEAWNLIGYGARSLRQYDLALGAYQRCLQIKPDYAPAREYLAEAYLLLNQPQKAREQMAWLEKAGASDELVRFKVAWDDWTRLHPEQSAALSAPASATPTTAGTAADSTSAAQKP